MSLETKILFAIYELHQSKKITNSQRGELKDLLIQRHPQIMSIEDDVSEQLLNMVSDTSSQVSVNSYKTQRPSKLHIKVPYRQLMDISESLNIDTQAFKKKL
ncbi:hypothetical protein pb186bvf_018701 [Paramecium bursaria]